MLYKKIKSRNCWVDPYVSYFPFFADFSCFGIFFDVIMKSIIDREKVKEAKMFSRQRSTKKSKSRNCWVDPYGSYFPFFREFFMFLDVFSHFLEKYNRYRESER